MELADKYVVTSNRESDLGRYDVMLEPRDIENDAFLLANLIAKGIPERRIRKYGFAFCGKRVLIGNGSD